MLEVRDPEKTDAGMIQQADDMKLSFFLPVPLNQGCKVTVVLPAQYSISTIKYVGTLQAFGSYKQYSLNSNNLVLNKTENSFTIEPCDSYRENDNVAILYISELMQYKYEKQTDSVQIRIDTAKGDKVARIQSGVTFTPVRGSTTV